MGALSRCAVAVVALLCGSVGAAVIPPSGTGWVLGCEIVEGVEEFYFLLPAGAFDIYIGTEDGQFHGYVVEGPRAEWCSFWFYEQGMTMWYRVVGYVEPPGEPEPAASSSAATTGDVQAVQTAVAIQTAVVEDQSDFLRALGLGLALVAGFAFATRLT